MDRLDRSGAHRATVGEWGAEKLSGLLGVPFTDEQLAAITAPAEPAVVVAGAGSGKTTVMAARVVWLVATGQVAPEQVLGLTFTNKAAGELAHRIRTALDRLRAGWGSGGPPLADTDGGGSRRGSSPSEIDGGGSRRGSSPSGIDGAGSGPVLRRSAADLEDVGEPTVLTYHAYAGRLLSEHGLRIGVEPDARLLADATRYQLAAGVIRHAAGPFTALTGRVLDIVGDLVALDSELSEHLVSTDELRDHDEATRREIESAPKQTNGLLTALSSIAKRRELATLVDGYRSAKRDRVVVDFSDQIAFAATLAEQRPEVGAAERDRFRVVLLDEYQDTSVAQRRMLAGLFPGGHPVMAVGDPCQAIYGWRGASVANLEEFPGHFPRSDGRPAPRYPLTENRRSGERILAAANSLSRPLRLVHEGVGELRVAADRIEQGLIRCALHETYSEEVSWLGDQVEAVLRAGTPAAQVAILVRVTSDFGPIHSELTRRDIPVEVVGIGGLLALPEVADMVATLRVLDDPTSNAALVRLLTGPRWRIGPRDLALLGQRAAQLVYVADGPAGEPDGSNAVPDPDAVLEEAVGGIDPAEVVSLADALVSPGRLGYSDEALERFAALAAEVRELRRHLGEPLLDLLHHVLTAIGLDVELGASPQARAARRRESLAAFLDVAAQFRDLGDDASLGAFLAYLQAADEYERGLDSAAPTGADSVKLLTVHKAKGLEWDVVMLPDLTATVFPTGRGRTRWTRSRKVLPFGLRGDAGSLPEVASWTTQGLQEFDNACRELDEFEERRLGYVAITRPRHLLVASGHWWGPSQKKPRGPSPYLETLAEQCRGRGEVDRWVERPAEEENPHLGAAAEAEWPAPLDPDALRQRREAADLVLGLLGADRRPGRYQQLALIEPADLPGPAPGNRLTPADEHDPGLAPAEAELVAAWDRDIEMLLGEARRLRRRNREITLPTTLTASQLLRIADDVDAFARDLARPLPRKPDPAARRGTRFHAWVESRFGQQPLLVDDDLPGAADADIADETDLAALQSSFEAGRYADRVPHALEAPFQLMLAGHVIRGRIDAVYETGDGGFEVVDWKTNRTQSADPLQLAVYRLAWAEMQGLPLDRVTAAFVYVRSGETVRPPDLPDRTGLEAILGAV